MASSRGQAWALLGAALLVGSEAGVPLSTVPLGCFNYGYQYEGGLLNITGMPYVVDTPEKCQLKCQSTPGCFHFGWFEKSGACYLAEPSAILTVSHLAGTVCGPGYCPKDNVACKGLPDAAFPGDTPRKSMDAWAESTQPTNLQCWPRRSDGFPARCVNRTAFVLEDTQSGWAGQCDGLSEVTDLGPSDTCQSRCMMSTLCGVWSLTTTKTSPTPVCLNGLLGINCHRTSGIKPLRAQRITHGSYRVLIETMGMEILGLTNTFTQDIFPDWDTGSLRCKMECLSYLVCQYWQYSKSTGCWLEDPAKQSVAYPLTTGGNAPGVSTDSDAARSIVAGQYLQHTCVGPMVPMPTESPGLIAHAQDSNRPAEAASHPMLQEHDAVSPSAAWPPFFSFLIFLGVALFLGVVGAAVWMGIADQKRKDMRRGMVPMGHPMEQAGLLGGGGFNGMHMPHMPWQHGQQGMQGPGQGQYGGGGIPGYGDMQPMAHQQTHGGHYFG